MTGSNSCRCRLMLALASATLPIMAADGCPGQVPIAGLRSVSIIPTGWGSSGSSQVYLANGALVQQLGARAYFADTCTAGHYDHEQYSAINLLGKSMRYTTDLTGAGCGCNVALYLVSMHQNPRPSDCNDFYCDANNVCGESCAEIDMQEANEYSWHTTLHTAHDHSGVGCGFGGGGPGWNGPRDWTSQQYGPGGQCIDTKRPFQVSVSFPVNGQGKLEALQVTLTQEGKGCPLFAQVAGYEGNAELTEALRAGMTPVLSYWRSDDMLWMDGPGDDGKGTCKTDSDTCGPTTKFYNFSIADVGAPVLKAGPPPAPAASNRGTSKAQREQEGLDLLRPLFNGGATLDHQTIGGIQPVVKVLRCPGKLNVANVGDMQMVPAGWNTPSGGVNIDAGDNSVIPHMGGRAYFAQFCTPGSYRHEDYMAAQLLGKTLRYSVDLTGVGCGCNAALSLVAMRQNTNPSQCSDYYCDASAVCGESCAEISLQEANQHAWHSTLHAADDHVGRARGYGGGDLNSQGPRDWSRKEYGHGGYCIDTFKPFEVAASFLVDAKGDFAALEVNLTQIQHTKPCTLSVFIDDYTQHAAISQALKAGMTPVVSYWSSTNTLWLDGPGSDGKGPCVTETPQSCEETVRFSNFAVDTLSNPVIVVTTRTTTVTTVTMTTTPKKHKPVCPGYINVKGQGPVSLVPAGWTPEGLRINPVDVSKRREVMPHLNSRGYFSQTCTAGAYDNKQYAAWNLLGMTLKYTVDVSTASCGCNAAFYLTSMRQNDRPGKCLDHYCDVSSLCGVRCAEIDIMQANKHAWHSTLHTSRDSSGMGGGYGGTLHDFTEEQFGPGGVCVDTTEPFDVAVSFPLDEDGRLRSVEVQLSQEGHYCPLELPLGPYAGMEELSKALAAGMTPVVSYWSSEDMLWLDGAVEEQQYLFLDDVSGDNHSSKRPRKKLAGCKKDMPDACGEKVKLYNFTIEKISREHATLVQMQQSMAVDVSSRSEENAQQAKNLTRLRAPASVGVVQDPSQATKSGCAQAWQQCNGGPGWVGPVCCEDGCACHSMNDGFGHCKPLEGRIGCSKSSNEDFLVQRFEGDSKPRQALFGGRLPWMATLGASILTALSVCVLFVCAAVRVGHYYLAGLDEGFDQGRRQDAELSKRVLMVRNKHPRRSDSYEAMRNTAEGNQVMPTALDQTDAMPLASNLSVRLPGYI